MMFSKKRNVGKISQWMIVVAVLFLLSISYVLYVIWVSMPIVRGTIENPLVESKVEVTRNAYGVPRIVGRRANDVYFAQGYTHAQDRMFQMVLLKHMFLGRMSELIGEKTIELDKYMRLFNAEASSEASYAQFNPRFKAALESYAAGVNAYIDENRDTLEARMLGFKVEKWRPQDSVVIQKAMAYDLSKQWPRIMKNSALSSVLGNDALDRYYPHVEITDPSVTDEDLQRQNLPYSEEEMVYPDGPQILDAVLESFKEYAVLNDKIAKGMSSDETLAPGSNIWAVSGERSESGMPQVASDPHLSYNVPNTFYLIHMQADNMSLTGASIPGAPGLIIGRNDHIAWGFTNSRLDQCDIFYGKDISGKVERVETFKIKGGKTVEKTYIDTDYGTLISSDGAEYEVALSWVGMQKVDKTLDVLHEFIYADSINTAKKHFKYFSAPAQNLVMADDQGNYGFYALGLIPDRSHSGRIAVPATEEYRWNKYIPASAMPYVENPPRGYVMNANNQVTSLHYGYNLSRLGFDDFRAVRLVKLLNEDELYGVNTKYSTQDTKRIQLDNEDQQWWIMRDTLLKTKPQSALAQETLEALDVWDGVAERDRYQVTIFSAWQRQIASRIYKPVASKLPRWAKPVHDDFFIIDEINNNLEGCGEKGCELFLAETLEAALQQLKGVYGTDDITKWLWQDSHKAIFKHNIFKKVPLLGSFTERVEKVDGTRDSLNRSRWFAGDKGFMGTQGACLRMVVDMASREDSYIMPMGESGNIFSKHYDDMLDTWAQGEYLTLPQTQSKGHEAQLLFYGSKD